MAECSASGGGATGDRLGVLPVEQTTLFVGERRGRLGWIDLLGQRISLHGRRTTRDRRLPAQQVRKIFDGLVQARVAAGPRVAGDVGDAVFSSALTGHEITALE